MLRLLRRASIRLQVMLPILLISNGGFLVGTGAFLWFQDRALRQAMEHEASAIADVTADNCLGALTFGDEKAAARTLESLARNPDVVHAALFTTDRMLFASYVTDGHAGAPEHDPLIDGHRFIGDLLVVVAPVLLERERLGTIAVEVSTARLQQLRASGLWLASVLFVLSLVTAALLTTWIERAVARPIGRLAQIAGAVSRDRDYTRRVRSRAENEVGTLVSAFNDMLSQIQARDEELERHRTQLSAEVDERTRELREALRTAEGLARAKAEFLATMSHEIRTPMNGVVGVAQMLLDTPMTAEQRDLAEMITHSGENLLVIINDILDFSRADAGRLEIERIPIDLVAVVEESAELLAQAAHEKGLEMVVSVAGDPSVRVLGDSTRLRQILLNLIGNAIKFTPHGGVTVGLEVERQAPDATAVARFRVEDTGIGIDPVVVPRIFDPFTQADGSTTRRFGGTGLGLAIVRQLARAMGGDVTVDSAVGRGSTFTVTLPFTVAAGCARLAPRPVNGWTALVIDDHPGAAAELRRRLETLGFDVDTTTSLRDAVPRVRAASDRKRRVLAFLDATVATTSGADAAGLVRLLSQPGSGATVLLESPGAQPAGARPAQCAYSLRKPLRSAALERVCRSVVEAETVEPAKAPPPAAPARLAGTRVLVAEDNAINQKVVMAMLKRLGCVADLAEDGVAAVERCREAPYDLVLMDCQMPEMDGFEATRLIRQQEAERGAGGRRLPIVALTANALSGDREACLAAGMDDYLSKPVSQPALAVMLERWSEAGSESSTADERAS